MNILKSVFAAMAVAMAFLCISTPAHAQDSLAFDTTKTYYLNPVIVTADRFKQKASSIGRNVTVIGRRQIANSIHYNVGELLAQQQSIHVVGSAQTPGALQSVFIRNSDSDNSVVLIDGVRISDPSSTSNNLNLANISLTDVKRIEIVRGSHSTLYGSSAIGGAINIITRAKTRPGFSGNIQTKQGIFSGDTYLTKNNAFAGYSWKSGWYVHGAASIEETPGLDATIDTVSNPDVFSTSDRDRFNKFDLSGKVGYSKNRWDAFISYRRDNQNVELDQGAFSDDDNAESDFNRNLFNYHAAYDASNHIRLKFTGGFSDLQRSFKNDSSVVDASGNFDGAVTNFQSVGSVLENKLTGRYKTSNFTGILGLGNSRQTMSIKTFIFNRPFNFKSRTNLDSLNLKQTISYVFAHTELSGGLVNESLKPFKLVLGGRLLSHNEFGTHATFEINPKVQITTNSLIYGAVTSGFNAPSLFQLHSPQKGFQAFTNLGNDKLAPETSISYELGWKQQIGNRLHFTVDLFKTRVKDVIEFVSLFDGTKTINNLGPGDFRGSTYLNASREDIKGLEAGLKAQLARRLNFHGHVSFTDSKLSFPSDEIDQEQTGGNHVQIFESGAFVSTNKDVNGLSRRPSFSGNFGLDYYPLRRLSFGLSSRFVGSRNGISFNPTLGPTGAQGFNKLDSYNLTNIEARYELNENLSFNFKINNLFDKNYQEINGFRTRGRGFFLRGSFSF